MKFGIVCMDGFNEKVGDIAVEAEELGYDSIWFADHIGTLGMRDPWTTLSYIAAKTTRLKLGSAVCPITRYNPGHLATMISNLDLLSNGRVVAGLGMGYQFYEFRNFTNEGVYDPPNVRFEKYEEALRLLLKLWTTPHPYPVNFNGKYYSTMDAAVWPKCVQQPHPLIWQGGGRRKSLELTAKYFDGWFGPIFGTNAAYTAEIYEDKVKKIQKFAKEYNRDMSKFTFASWGTIYDAGIPLEEIYGTPAMGAGMIFKMDKVELIEQYKAAGCQCWLIASPFMQQFAKEIFPSFTQSH